jgi:hypothetical protein
VKFGNGELLYIIIMNHNIIRLAQETPKNVCIISSMLKQSWIFLMIYIYNHLSRIQMVQIYMVNIQRATTYSLEVHRTMEAENAKITTEGSTVSKAMP